jgi:hypothetical protein
VTERPLEEAGAPDEPAVTDGAERGEADQGDARPEQGEPAPSTRRRPRPRRAVRGGTNPSAEDVPDVVAPRQEPSPGETQHDRWLREQRPPHWD